MADPRLEIVTQLAHEVRAFLEPHWKVWHAERGSPQGKRTLSEGTCGRSSRFLFEVLRVEGFDAELSFGSPIEGARGYRSETGWKGHAWVELSDPGCIIDVTADQFGDAVVVIAARHDPRYRRGTDVADPHWIHERQRVASLLLEKWHKRKGRV